MNYKRLGRCYWQEGEEISIRVPSTGEIVTTDKVELEDLGKRYSYREIGEEFGIGYVTVWRIFRDFRIKKRYFRKSMRRAV